MSCARSRGAALSPLYKTVENDILHGWSCVHRPQLPTTTALCTDQQRLLVEEGMRNSCTTRIPSPVKTTHINIPHLVALGNNLQKGVPRNMRSHSVGM